MGDQPLTQNASGQLGCLRQPCLPVGCVTEISDGMKPERCTQKSRVPDRCVSLGSKNLDAAAGCRYSVRIDSSLLPSKNRRSE